MSSAPTQIAVAPSASSLVTPPTSQIQKDFLDEPLARQNSLGNRVRGSGSKGKHLTRSHAMRESTSPPRTPTPRSELLRSSPTSGHSSSTETINDSRVHVQSTSTSSTSPSLEAQSVVIVSNQQQQQQQNHNFGTMYTGTTTSDVCENSGVICNQSQLDVEFPKLTPPKSSKSPRNGGGNSGGNMNRDSDKTLNNSSKEHNNTVMSNSICTHTISNVETNLNGRNKNDVINNKQNNINSTNNSNSNSNNSTPVIVSSNQMMATDIHHVPLTHSHQNHHHIVEQNSNNTNMNHSSSAATSPSQLIPSSPNLSFDKENRSPRNGNGINGNNNHCAHSHDDSHNNMSESPTEGSSKCERLGKKHRSGANAKGSKPRLKNMGSSSSVEGGNSTSGFISRDSSTEQFTDQSGVDLVQFFRETLNKNPKDRNMLMKIEKDLTELAHDKTKGELKFPAMCSYNRMLIHRVAAFFGMEHNVDTATQQCVIVAATKSTRIPEIRFKSLFRDRLSDEPRKSILKRDSHSFDDSRQGLLMCPDRGMLDRKAKSFEEREEEYEKVRRRIFRGRECIERSEEQYWPWSSSDSSDQSARLRQNNKLLKVQSSSVDAHGDGRPCVSKSHSFGGYGGPPQNIGPLSRGDSVNSTKSAGPRFYSKQDSTGSTNTPWRLSPSSSGYKTQTQSLRSDSVTPSPTGYGSDDHTPEPSVVQSPPAASCGVVWAVTDMASVPRGSVLINPQTLQPIVNQDGSIYHFDPSNLPPSQMVTTGYNKTMNTPSHRRKYDKQRSNKCEQTNYHSTNDNCGRQNNNNNNNNNIKTSDNSSNIREVSCNTRNTTTIESSVENLSESSSQTILVEGNQDIEGEEMDPQDDQDTQTTIEAKETTNHREMSDIQEESASQSLDDIDNKSVTNDNLTTESHSVPKLKNQATSPNIPTTPEPDQPTQFNEITTTNATSSEVNSTNPTKSTESAASSYTSSTVTNDNNKKEDNKSTGTSIPIVGYATTAYQNIDGSTMFSLANPATTYQGPDGNVYTTSQQMVYAYPPPMDAEVPTYFMHVYDQSSQRDANGSLVQAAAPALYQPTTGGTTTVVPVAYPTTPYSSTPIYPGQVVYSSPDQFTATTPATAGQMQQYPMSCPMGYPYPYTGYWGQAMAYYVPPTPVANAVPSTVIPPPIATVNSANGLSNQQHNTNNSGNGGKRNSPPTQNISSGNNSQSATPANTYQFAPGVPLTFTDPSMPTMYAIPQSAVFPNMLPYTPGGTPSTPAGVFSHLPHHQHSAVINPLITSHPPGPLGPPIPLESSSTNGGGFMLSNANGNHGNNSGTPHSAPSTPLSNSLPMQHQHRNPSLFATPPILPNGCAPQMHHSFHQSYNDASTMGGNNYTSSQSYERKTSNNNHSNSNSVSNNNNNPNNNSSNNNTNTGGGSMKKNNNNSHIQHNGKHSYTGNQQNQRKTNAGENINQNSQTGVGNIRPNQNIPQQKRTNIDKSQISNNILSNGTNMNNSAQINQDKPRTGMRPKPANLDLRRSASQRNSPSTNSAESNNNSPNSIVSNHHMNNSSLDHPQSVYMTRGTHIPQMHQPTAAAVVAAATAADVAACQQQLIGAYNPSGPTGMYVKYGQTYFPHPSMALPSNRRSPPNEFRPSLTPLTGVYPAVNMMLPAPRHMQPRHPNPHYKGNKPSR